MGDVVNLRRARRAKTRAASERQAAENRSLHGVSRAGREALAAEQELTARRHAAHRRDRPEDPGDGV
jgi:hypothetical protein